jgi:predicted O-methyltransferase YrrM
LPSFKSNPSDNVFALGATPSSTETKRAVSAALEKLSELAAYTKGAESVKTKIIAIRKGVEIIAKPPIFQSQ